MGNNCDHWRAKCRDIDKAKVILAFLGFSLYDFLNKKGESLWQRKKL